MFNRSIFLPADFRNVNDLKWRMKGIVFYSWAMVGGWRLTVDREIVKRYALRAERFVFRLLQFLQEKRITLT
jgi:hypothetical protein